MRRRVTSKQSNIYEGFQTTKDLICKSVCQMCLAIDLFTNVSQIYGFLPPREPLTSHFINLYLTMVFQYLESTLHILVVAMSDKLSGCQETTFVKMVCAKLVSPSITFRATLFRHYNEVSLHKPSVLTCFSE